MYISRWFNFVDEKYKSVNLQYNMLGRLDDGTNESSTKRLIFQVLFFFLIFINLGHSKLFIFIVLSKNKKIRVF